MRTFTITFNNSAPDNDGAIRFVAPDPMRALAMLQQHPEHDQATVWEGSRKVCCIARAGADLWRIT